MKLSDINKEIEEIEQKIFSYSLWGDLTITELGDMYCSLVKLKNVFLSSSLKEYCKEDIDSIRFKISEDILNLKIIIKEKLRINYDVEIMQMKKHWNSFAG